MGRTLIRALRCREEQLALAAVGAVLLIIVALPFGAPLFSIGSSGALARALRDLTRNSRLWLLLWRSTWLSSAITSASLVLGVPLGVLLGRTDVVGRRALALGLALPAS